MSTDFYNNEEYSLVTFYGGEKRGVCLQITPINEKHRTIIGSTGFDYISLNKDEVKNLKDKLEKWLEENKE